MSAPAPGSEQTTLAAAEHAKIVRKIKEKKPLRSKADLARLTAELVKAAESILATLKRLVLPPGTSIVAEKCTAVQGALAKIQPYLSQVVIFIAAFSSDIQTQQNPTGQYTAGQMLKYILDEEMGRKLWDHFKGIIDILDLACPHVQAAKAVVNPCAIAEKTIEQLNTSVASLIMRQFYGHLIDSHKVNADDDDKIEDSEKGLRIIKKLKNLCSTIPVVTGQGQSSEDPLTVLFKILTQYYTTALRKSAKKDPGGYCAARDSLEDSFQLGTSDPVAQEADRIDLVTTFQIRLLADLQFKLKKKTILLSQQDEATKAALSKVLQAIVTEYEQKLKLQDADGRVILDWFNSQVENLDSLVVQQKEIDAQAAALPAAASADVDLAPLAPPMRSLDQISIDFFNAATSLQRFIYANYLSLMAKRVFAMSSQLEDLPLQEISACSDQRVSVLAAREAEIEAADHSAAPPPPLSPTEYAPPPPAPIGPAALQGEAGPIVSAPATAASISAPSSSASTSSRIEDLMWEARPNPEHSTTAFTEAQEKIFSHVLLALQVNALYFNRSQRAGQRIGIDIPLPHTHAERAGQWSLASDFLQQFIDSLPNPTDLSSGVAPVEPPTLPAAPAASASPSPSAPKSIPSALKVLKLILLANPDFGYSYFGLLNLLQRRAMEECDWAIAFFKTKRTGMLNKSPHLAEGLWNQAKECLGRGECVPAFLIEQLVSFAVESSKPLITIDDVNRLNDIIELLRKHAKHLAASKPSWFIPGEMTQRLREEITTNPDLFLLCAPYVLDIKNPDGNVQKFLQALHLPEEVQRLDICGKIKHLVSANAEVLEACGLFAPALYRKPVVVSKAESRSLSGEIVQEQPAQGLVVAQVSDADLLLGSARRSFIREHLLTIHQYGVASIPVVSSEATSLPDGAPMQPHPSCVSAPFVTPERAEEMHGKLLAFIRANWSDFLVFCSKNRGINGRVREIISQQVQYLIQNPDAVDAVRSLDLVGIWTQLRPADPIRPSRLIPDAPVPESASAPAPATSLTGLSEAMGSQQPPPPSELAVGATPPPPSAPATPPQAKGPPPLIPSQIFEVFAKTVAEVIRIIEENSSCLDKIGQFKDAWHTALLSNRGLLTNPAQLKQMFETNPQIQQLVDQIYPVIEALKDELFPSSPNDRLNVSSLLADHKKDAARQAVRPQSLPAGTQPMLMMVPPVAPAVFVSASSSAPPAPQPATVSAPLDQVAGIVAMAWGIYKGLPEAVTDELKRAEIRVIDKINPEATTPSTPEEKRAAVELIFNKGYGDRTQRAQMEACLQQVSLATSPASMGMPMPPPAAPSTLPDSAPLATLPPPASTVVPTSASTTTTTTSTTTVDSSLVTMVRAAQPLKLPTGAVRSVLFPIAQPNAALPLPTLPPPAAPLSEEAEKGAATREGAQTSPAVTEPAVPQQLMLAASLFPAAPQPGAPSAPAAGAAEEGAAPTTAVTPADLQQMVPK